MSRSPAGLFFGEYLVAQRISFDAMARRVGCSPQHMRRLAGGQRPDFTLAVKIEDATGGIVHRGTWHPPFRQPPPKIEDPTMSWLSLFPTLIPPTADEFYQSRLQHYREIGMPEHNAVSVAGNDTAIVYDWKPQEAPQQAKQDGN